MKILSLQKNERSGDRSSRFRDGVHRDSLRRAQLGICALNTPYGLTFDSINENLFVFQQTGDAIYGYNTQIFYGGDTPPTYDVTPVNPFLK